MPDSDTLERTRFNFTIAIPVFEEWMKTSEADARARLDQAASRDDAIACMHFSRQVLNFRDLRQVWGWMSPPRRRDMLRTIWQAMEQAR